MRCATIRLAILAALLAWSSHSSRADEALRIERDVVYGHKDGMALVLDVIQPPKPNGAGVLYLQSSGWKSDWWPQPDEVCGPLLEKGFTVFVVRHGSTPKYNIPEAVEDVRRSVRFVRLRAKDWGVSPERLGAVGGSAGGHLTLMLATTGDDGDSAAKDEVLRQSSRVAATVGLRAPTDIRDWMSSNPPQEIKNRMALLKAPLSFDAAKAGDYSPVLRVTARTAPTLLVLGDKDEVIPLDHSRKMIAAMEKEKVPCRLVIVEGARHMFSTQQNRTMALAMVAWFEQYLVGDRKDR